MASLVNESIFSYMGEIESNGLELKIKLDGNVPLNLIGDSIRIKQIIGNLLKNAIVHANANTIEIGCKVATLESDMTSLIFHVKDDGVGVSSENQEHIFDLFYKAENNSAGAGLGLAVCKELVERMGGEIWIESGKEGGSTFYFTLPFRIEKVQKADVRAGDGKSVQGLSGLRILLAEDNIINQALIKEMLKRKEMWVTAVGNGAEVLRALENDHYDLVLMDIQMPIMDGLITTKRIRESQNPIPIIALTASVMRKEKEQFIKNGMNGVVEKPVFIDALLKEINLQVAR